MDLRHLRMFVAVAQELSFTKAAQRLHMAQPPLSQGIASFEQELGVKLFHRTTRTIELTAIGRDLLPEAVAILQSVEQFSKQIEARRRGELGELHLSVISSLANAELASQLRLFRQENPGLTVSLDVHPSVWQLNALKSGDLDAGFLSSPLDSLEGLDSLLVAQGKMSLIVPKGHRLAKRKNVRWSDLREEPMIWLEPEALWENYYEKFKQCCWAAGFDPQVSQYSPNVATQVWMVSAGLGVAPIQITHAARDWPGVVFLNLPNNAPSHEIRMAWKKADPSPALHRFIDFVRRYALADTLHTRVEELKDKAVYRR